MGVSLAVQTSDFRGISVTNHSITQEAHGSSLRKFPSKQKTGNKGRITTTPFCSELGLIVYMVDVLLN